MLLPTPEQIGGLRVRTLQRWIYIAILSGMICGGVAHAGSDPACPLGPSLPPSDVLIGYVAPDRVTGSSAIQVLGVLRGSKLSPSDGSAMRDGMEFWQVLALSAPPTSLRGVSSHLDRHGEDHCTYSGEVAAGLATWTLLSSRPLPGGFHSPSPSDTSHFTKHRGECVDQGDYEPSKRPPCTRPKLLVVSDVDRDGRKEYWATEPYTWDTGITVWERSEDGLVEILSTCPGCSD
jgi:hypothetical protein